MNSIYDYLYILYDEVRVIKTPREGLKTVFFILRCYNIHLSRFNTSDNYNNFFYIIIKDGGVASQSSTTDTRGGAFYNNN